MKRFKFSWLGSDAIIILTEREEWDPEVLAASRLALADERGIQGLKVGEGFKDSYGDQWERTA